MNETLMHELAASSINKLIKKNKEQINDLIE